MPLYSATPETSALVLEPLPVATASEAVADETRVGLTSTPKTLSPWLFYDEAGSQLFEQITALPEYYLTRTERAIFTAHADEIVRVAAGEPRQTLTLIEPGAGSAAKTRIMLEAAVRLQGSVVYQPVDVSATALESARKNILGRVPGVSVRCQVADYTREPLPENRLPNTRTLALYIGSSIGNFTPNEALALLQNLRAQLLPGDQFLLGADLVKDVTAMLAAYNDAAGVTAAFNRNVLERLNRELDADFDLSAFRHKAIWNARESRIEMHLESLCAQRVHVPANSAGDAMILTFARGETIHTENSYKFTPEAVESLLSDTGFRATHTWNDDAKLFAVTLASAV
ncbi:histidine N-alpha-methyltransferase [Edaphobacter acidisoli]|uniref:Histidine N-alpha-methyltransferase n=1 Tax=Edaphobacter acidisoli TaxID=2040573 RepID=A0A916RZT5_9BACT|nr:L-histidine N(alpha)-methyltransferase [Edaphobacter acidisoli]GGA75620.1 histidine N-alpha-methyltransferase [Edaphobacter acidisoli]